MCSSLLLLDVNRQWWIVIVSHHGRTRPFLCAAESTGGKQLLPLCVNIDDVVNSNLGGKNESHRTSSLLWEFGSIERWGQWRNLVNNNLFHRWRRFKASVALARDLATVFSIDIVGGSLASHPGLVSSRCQNDGVPNCKEALTENEWMNGHMQAL